METEPGSTPTRWRMGVLGLCALLACSDSCSPQVSRSTVEIYSWWVSGAEVVALSAVIKDFRNKNPEVDVTNAAAQTALNAQSVLQSRLRLADPPDTVQVNGGAELRQYVEDVSPSQIEALDDLATQQSWTDIVPTLVLSAVTFGARRYAVPVDIARINTLFYNKQIFDSAHLTPPTTLAEFVQVAEALRSQNIASPLAVGDLVPWTLEIIFKTCMIAEGGANYYRLFTQGENSYLSGAAGYDATFSRTIACFATIMSYADKSGMRSRKWDQAVMQVQSGYSAMTIMGDWAVGEFVKDNKSVPGVDFDELPAPGSKGTFIFTTDTFVLPKGAKNRSGALALLREWGSAEGQRVFSRPKGTLAARIDVNKAASDAITRQTWRDFNDAVSQDQLVPDWALAIPQAFSTNFDPALDRFVDDGNAENLVLAARNNYHLIKAGHWP